MKEELRYDLAAFQLFYAFYSQNVRTAAAYFCTHCVKHAAQILNVRFASGVCNNSCSAGKGCGHKRIFGRRNENFVQKQIGTDKLICHKRKAPINVDGRNSCIIYSTGKTAVPTR